MLDYREVGRVEKAARNTHLQHEFAGHLGLAEAVGTGLFDVDILIHNSRLLSQSTSLRATV